MKKFIISAFIALTLAGCLNTENRRVKVRRDVSDIESGISIVSTSTVWWRTPYYKDTPKDQNPWLKFVRTEEDRWHDPWSQPDPILSEIRTRNKLIIKRNAARVCPKANSKPRNSDEAIRLLLREKLNEFRNRQQEVY